MVSGAAARAAGEAHGPGAGAPGTVTEAVYARIRGDILLGMLRPGQKLKLDGMRGIYDASVSTLRETLSRLVSDGLVSNEGQRGFQVVPATLADLRDIIETRLLMEVHAARRALARRDIDWEAALVAAYHKLSRVEALVEADPDRHSVQLEAFNRGFHATLVAGCGSRWLTTFHGVMYDQSLRYRMLAFQVRDFPRDLSRREHKEILDHALASNADALEKVLTAHITKGLDTYVEADLAKVALKAAVGQAAGR